MVWECQRGKSGLHRFCPKTERRVGKGEKVLGEMWVRCEVRWAKTVEGDKEGGGVKYMGPVRKGRERCERCRGSAKDEGKCEEDGWNHEEVEKSFWQLPSASMSFEIIGEGTYRKA